MLEACHRAGVEVVIKSGRREGSVMEDAKLIGSRSYICEVGCLVAMDGERTVLVGDLEPEPGKTLAETMVDSGIPDELFEQFAGRLEWHSPWHRQREFSLLFRGKVDVDDANRLPRRARPQGPAPDRQRRDLRPDGGDRGAGARLPPAPGGGQQGERRRLSHEGPRLRARRVHRDRRLGRGPRRRRRRRPLLRARQWPGARSGAARGDRRPSQRHGHRGPDGGGVYEAVVSTLAGA